MEMTLDQTEYASKMANIAHPQLSTGKPEEKCVEALASLYRSLLGAIAYLSLTHVNVHVFISAMQRHGQAPEVQHVRRLNKLLRWVQRHPTKLHYKRFSSQPKGESHLRIISDAAFKKETNTGHCMRGALFLRSEGTDFGNKNCVSHLLEWTCRAQRHVTRSTFAAELLSAGDAADQGMLIAQMMHEVEHGPLTAAEARRQRETKGHVPTALYIDAMSVYAAISATF